MKRFIYPVYLLALLAIGVSVIAPIIKSNDSSQNALTLAAPVPSLGFYSARVPFEAQTFLRDWLKRNDVTDTSANNVSVRGGSYDDKTYRLGDTLYRNVDFYIDIKKPSVSYKVEAQINLATNTNPLVYVTCPDGPNQHGVAANCKGMTQI